MHTALGVFLDALFGIFKKWLLWLVPEEVLEYFAELLQTLFEARSDRCWLHAETGNSSFSALLLSKATSLPTQQSKSDFAAVQK